MPTTITKTIGSGGDYSTVQAWYNGINTDAGGTNLVSLDKAAVGKVIGNITSTGQILLTSGTVYTTDGTHTITLTGNSAESYSGGLNWNTAHGPSLTSSAVSTYIFDMNQTNFIVSNLQLQSTGSGSILIRYD